MTLDNAPTAAFPESSGDESAALSSIEALLDNTGNLAPPSEEPVNQSKDDVSEDEARILDAATDENPSSEPDEEAQGESESSIVEPPRSWSKEDVEKFKQLPPEMQSLIATREGERDRLVLQKTTEIAEQRKAFESQQNLNQQAQVQYVNALNHLLNQAVPELKQFDNVNWMKLSQEDPAEYVRLSGLRDELRGRVVLMEREQQRITQEHQRTRHQQVQQVGHAEVQALVQKDPSWSDPAKMAQQTNDITAVMKHYGFTGNELGEVLDHRVFLLLNRYAKLEKAETARQSAIAKKTSPAAPKFQSGNSAPARETRSAKSQLGDQMKLLKSTGDPKVAQRLLEQLL
jgi:hypothetical protein